MINEKNIIKIVAIGPLIFIPIVVMSFALLLAKISNDSYKKSVAELELHVRKEQNLLVKSKVDSIREHIEYRKSVIKAELISRVRQRVLDSIRVADAIHEKYKDTKSQKEIMDLIITGLRPLVWNDGESFIWIINYDGVFQLAPKYLRHLEGKSIIDFQDLTGKYVIKEEIEVSKTKGEGILWDTFTKPTAKSDKQFKQVAFVKSLGFYDWYFGSGEYIDTTEKKVNKILLESISKIDKVDNNYLFIIRDDGTFLAHIDTQYIGANLRDISPSVYDKLKHSIKNKENAFISYSWKNNKTGKTEIKHTYISKIPGTDWIIGSGYYESDIKTTALEDSSIFKEKHYVKLKYILAISSVLIIISLIASYYLSKHIKRTYKRYQQRIGKKNFELQHLNETLEHKVQNRTKKLKIATEQLELLATTDSLTQVHNRYSIMNILKLEMERSNRHNIALSVALYDLDFFKKVNDTFGHDVGDEVLTSSTKLVKSVLRDVDIIGRYGGEEFLIIMPATSLENAKEVSHRVHKAVEDYNFDKVGSITVSIGLVEMSKGESMEALFKRLDNLLYVSKDTGRNKISF